MFVAEFAGEERERGCVYRERERESPCMQPRLCVPQNSELLKSQCCGPESMRPQSQTRAGLRAVRLELHQHSHHHRLLLKPRDWGGWLAGPAQPDPETRGGWLVHYSTLARFITLLYKAPGKKCDPRPTQTRLPRPTEMWLPGPTQMRLPRPTQMRLPTMR
jgi:hypothetical protein